MSDKKNKKSAKAPQVIDNTNSTFDLSFEKNKDFDFGEEDENDGPQQEIPAEAPKKKISIVLNDAPTQKKLNTSRLSALPPSKSRSSPSVKNEFEKGIDSFELAEYAKSVQYFMAHASTCDKREEAQLCLAYQLTCNIIQRILTAPGSIDVYLASILICIPLLPPHRKVVLAIVKTICCKESIQLPESIMEFCGISPEVNSSRQPLNGVCRHCGKEISLMRSVCDCGKERLFDCLTFAPIGNSALKCEKCGAIFSETTSCVFCKGGCRPTEI